MDHTLHEKLVALVLKISGIEDFDTRTALLAGIPLSLSRNRGMARTDISRLVDQLAEKQLLSGEWTLLRFIDNAIPYLENTLDGKQLKELRLTIEASLQQTEQSSSSPASTQPDPQAPAAHSPPPTRPSPGEQGTSNTGFPHGYALIVGISSYADTRLKLSTAPLKDAMDMHTVLRKAEYCGYQDQHVEPLINHEATAKNLREKLKWLAEVTEKDEKATVLFYFSGHGGRIEIDGQVSYYLLPFDCNLDNLGDTALPGTELAQLFHAIRPPRLLVLLDNCYAGGIDEIKGVTGKQGTLKYGREEEYYQQLAQGRGRVIIASSGPEEPSRSWPALNNSLFTHYLLKALQGEATSLGDGLIRVSELFSYLYTQVPKDRPQHPVMITPLMENFPIALYQGGQRMRPSNQQSVDQRKRELVERVDHTSLRKAIVQAFTLEELGLLCDDIEQTLRRNGINEPLSLDMLTGTALPTKAQSLIGYCERRGWIGYLLDEITRARPNLAF